MASYIYFACSPSQGIWKIGRTRCLSRRLAQYHTVDPSIELIHWYETPWPKTEEASWHERTEPFRAHGKEWFTDAEIIAVDFLTQGTSVGTQAPDVWEVYDATGLTAEARASAEYTFQGQELLREDWWVPIAFATETCRCGTAVRVRCPYCEETHTHGNVGGYRRPHCRKMLEGFHRRLPDYLIVPLQRPESWLCGHRR